jgi:hypothetical protein
VEAQVWSLIHGYATLHLSRRLWPDRPRAEAPDRFDEVMALLDHLGEVLEPSASNR